MRQIRTFSYTGEGWGMTKDKTSIITSDGSDTLRFRNPQTFAETRHIVVHDGAKTIDQLNELEFIKGEIWSNVWHDNRIARISPRDGHVISWVDLTGILPDSQKKDAESVLNGIAYDAEHDRIFVTGKQWPAIFEIKVVPKQYNRRCRKSWAAVIGRWPLPDLELETHCVKRCRFRHGILSIINDGATAYRGVIPADRLRIPYMSAEELQPEIAGGVTFFGWEEQAVSLTSA